MSMPENNLTAQDQGGRENLAAGWVLLCFPPDAPSDAETYGNFHGCAVRTEAAVLCWCISSALFYWDFLRW